LALGAASGLPKCETIAAKTGWSTHSHANRLQTGSDNVRNHRLAWQDERQRPWPESFRQRFH
jgi:hypothetical protein